MSRRAITTALVLAAAAVPASAQTADPLLTFTEVTRTGREQSLSADLRAVDINSSIRIGIDRDALYDAVGGARLPERIAGDAAALSEALRGINERLAALRTAEAEFQSERTTEARAAYVQSLRTVGPSALLIIDRAPRGSALRAELEAALIATAGQQPSAQYAAVFGAAAAYVDRLQGQVEALAAREGVRVRMGAWLVTGEGAREVHLPGFDTVQTQAPSVVAPYQIILTEEQARQFRELQAQARTLRTQVGASPFADAAAIRDRLRSVAIDGLGCVDSIAPRLNALPDAARQRFLTANRTLLQRWTDLKSRYASGTVPTTDLLVSAPTDAAAAWDAVQQWLGGADALLGQVADETAAGIVEARNALQGCRTQVETRLGAELAPLVGGLTSSAASRLATESLEFSSRVLSLDLASVPALTELSLVTAGSRSPGDQLALRMSTRDAAGTERVLATRTLLVERAEPHIHLSVAMIWAYRDPPQDAAGTARGNQWHPAPGYSILVKRAFGDAGLARRYPFYAEVLNPGIGINLSAPDFDLDDTPEFAAGVVVSVFRDYIQGGWSFNFQQNRGFPFIGIRLPLPSATIPAGEGAAP